MNIPDIHIGQEIKNIIKSKNFSYEEVAKKLNVGNPAISRLISRKEMRSATIAKISEALNYNLFTKFSSPPSSSDFESYLSELSLEELCILEIKTKQAIKHKVLP